MALEKLTEAVVDFIRARDWERYHSPKNLAMALTVEAGELMEPLQWLGHEESRELVKAPELKAKLESEVADVLIYLIQFCQASGIDPEAAAWAKLEQAGERYKVDEQRQGFFKVSEEAYLRSKKEG